MIVRIVKLKIHPERMDAFAEKFRSVRDKITSFSGCRHVELLDAIDEPDTVFTYSLWENEESLEDYRRSDLFDNTWTDVKSLFNGKPEAWSLRSHNDSGGRKQAEGI